MGMYTEIYVNVDFKEETPDVIIDVIRAMCNGDEKGVLVDRPNRWNCLFSNMSYYTPSTSVAKLTFDAIGNRWSLIGKGDIKNYDSEIESFFEFIEEWVEDDFMGYMRYEEYNEPTLIFTNSYEKESKDA